MLAAGIPNIRRAVHSLRHTAGADSRRRGTDIRDIQDVLRHANISSTRFTPRRKKLPPEIHGSHATAVLPG